jgi:predicted phage baseplate assembly protein
VQQCGPLSARPYAPAKLQWEGWDGVRWTALDLLRDDSFALTQSGHMRVRVPQGNTLTQDYLGTYEEKDRDGAVQPKLFWLRARLLRSQYERAPILLAVRINTVPALQAQTVEREILGGADGRRNQTFQLANAPVIRGSVKIEIDDGIVIDGDADAQARARAWEVRDDLLGSGPDDKHLALNFATGKLRAGDGEFGEIPVANPNNPDANVVALEYRHGGGARGNVAAKSLKNLLTPVDGIDGGKTENLFAAIGGCDEEKFEDAVRRAQKNLRARDRAMTADDFRYLVEKFGDVKRAEVLPLAHPGFPGVKVPGAVSVIVVPDSKAAAPMPSDALLGAICRQLDEHRLLTTELFVVAPRYVPVSIDAEVVAEDAADPGKVRQDVEEAIAKYLHPLEGGDDEKGWPFGGVLRYSKLLRQVLMVPGVDSVSYLRIFVDAEQQPEHRDVPLESFAPHALIELRANKVSVVPAAEHEATTA